jgi:N-glycosylase/DNA lyase
MKPWQIERAVTELCRDVERVVERKNSDAMSEQDLEYELLICILGSGVHYEVSVAYADEILLKGIPKIIKNITDLSEVKIQVEEILSAPAFSSLGGKFYKKYRYPKKSANYIVEAFDNIYFAYGSFLNLISLMKTPSIFRRVLIDLCPGIGPKQSSHYLKNIGFTDNVAILDRHIINYLRIIEGDKVCLKQISKIDKYEEVEKKFIDQVSKYNYSVSVVDQSMWFVMRALGKEAYL